MTDLNKDRDLESAPDSTSLDDDEVRWLLRHAMRVDTAKPRNLLPAVQREIRLRSHGKFYADGWSVGRSPRSTYIVTSVIMVLVALLIFLALVPWQWAPL